MQISEMMPVVGLEELESLAVDLTDVPTDDIPKVIKDEDVTRVAETSSAIIRLQLDESATNPPIQKNVDLTAVTEYYIASFEDRVTGAKGVNYEIIEYPNNYVLSATFEGITPGVCLAIRGIPETPAEDIDWRDGMYYVVRYTGDPRISVFLPVLHTDLYLPGEHRFN